VAALRALCEAHWSNGGGPARPRAEDDAAARALDALGLGAAHAGHRSASVNG
jgi:hypothetical protein